MIDNEKNRRRIRDAATWTAFETLIASAGNYGLETRDLTGVITGVKFYRDGAYVFAVQSNPAHLNFYIRKPAQQRWGAMSERASKFDVSREERGEIQIHLREPREAKQLADWLFTLP